MQHGATHRRVPRSDLAAAQYLNQCRDAQLSVLHSKDDSSKTNSFEVRKVRQLLNGSNVYFSITTIQLQLLQLKAHSALGCRMLLVNVLSATLYGKDQLRAQYPQPTVLQHVAAAAVATTTPQMCHLPTPTTAVFC